MRPDLEFVDSQLTRLEALQGTDPAIFALAVHAFIEGTLRLRYDLSTIEIGFNELVSQFIEECIHDAQSYIPEIATMKELKHTHIETNEVRHRFSPAGNSTAQVATCELECFCKLAELGTTERLSRIRQYLDAWDQRIPLGSLCQEFDRMKTLYAYEKKTNLLLASQVEELTKSKQALWELTTTLKTKEAELARLEQSNVLRTKKIEKLRTERFETQTHIKEMQEKLKDLQKAQEYVDTMRRMTVFTRTRGSYEKLMLRLTAEQASILDQIHLDGDFLIRGSAGTGKSLVLIKAMEKAMLKHREDKKSTKVALLTFTNTLVKFNRYMVSILSGFEEKPQITTVDAFLLERLQQYSPCCTPSTEILKALCQSHAYEGMSAEDLEKEIDCFLLKQDVSYQEYVEQLIHRTGMKKPLKRAQRQRVWEVRDGVVQSMEEQNIFCFTYIPLLLQKMVLERGIEENQQYDQLFIDEAQDLGAGALRALKQLSRGCVVLCGDEKQSIYQVGSSFARSGLDVVGRAKVLRTNFRNSVQIHSFAQAFKLKDEPTSPHAMALAFRDGPMPELFRFTNKKEQMHLLAERVSFFTSLLEYEAENICILTPSKGDFPAIEEALAKEGRRVSEVLDKDFRFEDRGAIRLSTMHSAKGLDFPVVLLCLGSEPRQQSQYDAKANEQILRNLIYVSITRALDHLNLFIPAKSEIQAFNDLIACFEHSCS